LEVRINLFIDKSQTVAASNGGATRRLENYALGAKPYSSTFDHRSIFPSRPLNTDVKSTH
jgi:hypothetical protein